MSEVRTDQDLELSNSHSTSASSTNISAASPAAFVPRAATGAENGNANATASVLNDSKERSWIRVGVMSLSHFMSDFYTAFLPVLLPILAVRYDISYTESASIFMVFSVAMNFIQPPIGIWADKGRINYLFPLSILTSGILASIVLESPNFALMMAIVGLCGICSSCFHPISAGVLANVIPKKHQGLGTSFYIAGGNIGFAIAPVVVAAYLDYFGEHSLVYMMIPAIVTVALIYLNRLHVARIPEKVTVKNLSGEEQSFWHIIASREFVILNTSLALRSTFYCSLVVFIPLMFHDKGYSSVEGASCLMTLLLGAVAGGIIGGTLNDRFGPKKVTIATFILALVTGLIFLYYSDLSLIALAAIFCCGAGVYGSTPNAIVWAQRLLPNNAAFAASMMLGFTFGAGYIISVFIGYLGDLIGLQNALFYANGAAMLLAIVLLLTIKEPPARQIN